MASVRQIVETKEIGKTEKLIFTLDTSTWPSPPLNAGSVTMRVYAGETSTTDVASTVTDGSVTVSGTDLIFKRLLGTAMTQDLTYRVEVDWVAVDADLYGAYGFFPCRR